MADIPHANDTFTRDLASAETIAGKRAILFYLMAGAVVLSAIIGMRAHVLVSRSVLWLITCAIMGIHLTPAGTWLNRNRRVHALLNDEGTRAQRLIGFTAGFWAALASSCGVAIAGAFVPIPGASAAQIIGSAALAAALIAVATLERHAARDE